jgi:hypothetical protein
LCDFFAVTYSNDHTHVPKFLDFVQIACIHLQLLV